MLKEKAVIYFNKGYSCSESMVQAAIEAGLLPEELLPCATSFSGGMGVKCLCGAVAGAQIVIGYLHGKGKTELARGLAKEFVEKFKESHKVTCCKVLTQGFDFHSSERREHCANMVYDCAKILEEILEGAKHKV